MKEDKERTPLRTILTNFLNHIDTLENQRTPANTYESEFQELKLFSESIKGTKQYSCSEGEKEVNRKKNRYKDILPFDVSRVVLSEYAGVPGSDYINANYIRGASGSPAYIASQGPLPHTVNDFWRMVVQCEVQVIVMACNEEEAGKHKCENYWVEGEGEEKQFGMVSLRLIKASTVCPDFSVRTMRLKYTNTQSNTEERTVCQFHYSAWPDHGVPPLVRPLLDMVRLVRDTQASETLPVLIHCSAGCGRTGTICAIDYVWGLLRAGKLTKDFSLLSLVREMRRQRIAMVQTKEQYVLVHQAVRELFKEQLRMIDSHPYENIDCNGLPLIKCPSPEPTYDTISSFQNNKAEEKQDEKEKELAPPLPQKKRFQTLSSKQAKEVENLSERQRLVERAGSSSESVASTGSSGLRPKIATLRSLFERQHSERDTRQVSRSHSLGSTRHSQPNPVEVREPPVQKPIPGRGILRVPQPQAQPKPALPVKRSKSLRVLGSGDRSKLSVPPPPPAPCESDAPRRLSLESNFDEIKDLVHGETTHPPLSDYLSVDSIVAGLGVRERRNSFRRAVHQESTESVTPWPKKPALLRSYTSVDMRSAREKPDLTQETPPAKPLLRPKPNIQSGYNQPSGNDLMKTPMDPGLRPNTSSNSPFSALNELKKYKKLASSSRTITTHSMSLRLAPKPRREDCRILMSPTMPRIGASYRIEHVGSSGESSLSASSDQSLMSNKPFSPINSRPALRPQPSCGATESVDSEVKDKQGVQLASHHKSMSTPSNNPDFQQDKNNQSINPPKDSGQIVRQRSVAPPVPYMAAQPFHQRAKSSGDLKKNLPTQNVRAVVYDSKGSRQNPSVVYTTAPKATPPPYVEPGKNAQKPRSSPHSMGDKQSNMGLYDEMYGKTQEQRHHQVNSSSKDMMLSPNSSNNKPNLTGTDVRLDIPETSELKFSRSTERRKMEPDFKVVAQELYPKKYGDRRQEVLDYRQLPQESQPSHVIERKYQEQELLLRNERRPYEQEHHKNPQESVSKNPTQRRHIEQTFRPNLPESFSKPLNSRRQMDLNAQQNPQDQPSKNVTDRREQEIKSSQQDAFYRSINEYRQSHPDCFPNVGERRKTDREFRSSPQGTGASTNERGVAEQEKRVVSQEQYSGLLGKRPANNYQISSERRPDPSNYQSLGDRRPLDPANSNMTPGERRSADSASNYQPLGDRRGAGPANIYQTSGEKRMADTTVNYLKLGERRPSDIPTNFQTPVDRRPMESNYQTPGDRRPVDSNYQPLGDRWPMETNYQTPGERRPADQDFQRSSQEARALYIRATSRPSTNLSPPDRITNESDQQTPVTHGVKMRRGSRDDLALCATAGPRVKRHASVVLLRHSVMDPMPADATNSPLTLWNQTNAGGDLPTQPLGALEDPWSGAVGVDLDQVAASITTRKDGKMMRAALEALHLRKASQSTPKSTPTAHKGTQPTPKQVLLTPKSSQPTPKQSQSTSSPSKPTASSSQSQLPPETPKPGPFRKQQQYL